VVKVYKITKAGVERLNELFVNQLHWPFHREFNKSVELQSIMKFEGVVTCPFCKHKGTDFKLVKDWAHGLHLVNRFTCKNVREISDTTGMRKHMVQNLNTQYRKLLAQTNNKVSY
jgi:DNA-binding PadR family transcriptional regulator